MDLVPPITAPLDAQRRALREGCGVFSLDDLAVLAVTGNDRASWLNGVVTNDTRALAAGQSVYAAAVAVKGKLLADLWIHARADALLLVVPSSQADALLAHLERYIVMEDVAVARTDLALVTAQGPASEALAARFAERYRADRLGRGGWDLVADAAAPDTLRAALSDGLAVAVGREAWEAERVAAVVPRFGVDFDTANFVQEAAITPRAVSFNKGCYLGQEVVCRLEMRGHVQRLLVGLSLPGDAPPVGAKVTSEGQEVGVVTSAAPSLDGGAEVIAMVKYAAVEKALPLSVDGVAATVRKALGA